MWLDENNANMVYHENIKEILKHLIHNPDHDIKFWNLERHLH